MLEVKFGWYYCSHCCSYHLRGDPRPRGLVGWKMATAILAYLRRLAAPNEPS